MQLHTYEREHLATLRTLLPECTVLLKSNGDFPLQGKGKIALYGSGAKNTVKGGTGSGEVNSRYFVSIEQGLRDAGFIITSYNWINAYDKVRAEAKKRFVREIKERAKQHHTMAVLEGMGAVMPEPEYELTLDGEGDTAIYVLSRISGEGNDRDFVSGDILLSETEIRDILALNQKYRRFLLVLNVGGPVDLSPVMEVENILLLSQLGVETGSALADLLLGKTYPSGKLTTTWTTWYEYCPDIEVGALDDTYYREGVYVGYRYFDTVGKRALFPFGYGRSYTEFALGEAGAKLEGSTVTLSVEVQNIGAFAGKEVDQAYVTAPEGRIRKPWQDLAGYAKTGELEPDAAQMVEVSFDLADLASFDEEACAYVLEEGDYVLRLGTSSVDTEPVAVVVLEEDVTLRTVRPVLEPSGFEEAVYERAVRAEQLESLPRLVIDASAFETVSTVYDAEPEIEPEVAALSDEELAYLNVGSFSGKGGLLSVIGNASTNVAGAAGESTSKLIDKGIRPIVMADGPAGLRLAKDFYRDGKGAHSLGGGSIPDGILDVLSAPLRALAKLVLGGSKPPKGAELLHQYCTALPVGTAVAQSWNLDYAEACGDVVGEEMERFGVHLWLAPALNIHRSILCGRNFEYYSEDPLVSGKVAAAITRGVQAHAHRGTTIKHFAANNQETNRYFNSSRLSERAMREIYLKGFQICVRESQPLAVMTSYNLANGIHTSESRALTEGFLRSECGFAGIVMTDWVLPLKNRGTRYAVADAGRVAAAGGDLFMPGSQGDYDSILTALKDGGLTRHQLEVNASRVLRMSRKLNG